MAHALCMLDNYGYKHTITICNTLLYTGVTYYIQVLLICNAIYVEVLPYESNIQVYLYEMGPGIA